MLVFVRYVLHAACDGVDSKPTIALTCVWLMSRLQTSAAVVGVAASSA